MVASAIATDTLLVENDAERLEKGEEADAIDEYERERDGRPTRAEEERIAEIRRQRAEELAQQEAKKREARERAKREAAAPLPAGWTRHTNTDTRPNARPYYYHNAEWRRTGAPNRGPGAHTIWVHPGLEPPTPWVPPAPAPAAHTLAANAPFDAAAPLAAALATLPAAAPAPAVAAPTVPTWPAPAPAPFAMPTALNVAAPFAAPAAAAAALDASIAMLARPDATPPRGASIDLTAESPALECVPRKVARASTGSRVTDRKALEERMAADGWTKEEKQREGSATVDKYWIDPKGGSKCRSLIEVARRAYPDFLSEAAADAPKRTAKKSLEDLIGERLIAPGPIVFSWPMTGEVRVRAEGILNASGKIWYEGNEYVPTGFARRAFQACNVDPSATGTTFINGYDYLTMKGSGVRIKDLR